MFQFEPHIHMRRVPSSRWSRSHETEAVHTKAMPCSTWNAHPHAARAVVALVAQP
ncbi:MULTISPECIES: hypothetical protein [unclassified Myxococcus]|uniref:hypothetical protein n=1 Tax=unclassified Myxococcus TaxID=2648731 RepID=UPI001CBDFB4F|nr:MULTISPECIES: hypothetical protein [unclassified Myxococcus]MBZ4399132.1 hypothetical protein [Myxococcus sp. AS-1-15]MBZ4411664.1 hypothetical protein [Myxococcus sp. XM-1-1-1]BDT38782.1 hypothetical protein MFMH1_84510 [Myxococcus sp. MH1]